MNPRGCSAATSGDIPTEIKLYSPILQNPQRIDVALQTSTPKGTLTQMPDLLRTIPKKTETKNREVPCLNNTRNSQTETQGTITQLLTQQPKN